jgi:hypothetical protein
MIHINTRELSPWPISEKFFGCRLQHGVDIGGARYSKPSGLHRDINRPQFGSPALVCCVHDADQGYAKQTSCQFSDGCEAHKRCRRRGELNYRCFTDAGWEMSESIRKIRQVIFALKGHSHTGGDVVGGIVGASELAIIVSVDGNTVVKYDSSTCSD